MQERLMTTTPNSVAPAFAKHRLYYSPGTCALAPHIVLEEIDAPYELHLISASGPRDGEMTSKPEWKAINPKARVPALLGVPGRIGGADNLLTEVPAILMYLARTNPDAKLLPSDPAAEARCIEDELAAVRNRGRENVSESFAYIEKLLADGRNWAIPQGYTIVDAYLLVFYYWGRCRIRLDMEILCPTWTRLSELVADRPAVRRALKTQGIRIFEDE
jgi:glutathione S-transferase